MLQSNNRYLSGVVRIGLVLPLIAVLATAEPLAAEELTLTFDVIELEERGELMHAKVRMTATNTGDGELANVDARAAGGTFLAQGVLQFQRIPGGEARVVDATFVVRTAELSPDWVIPLRVEFDDAAGETHERHLVARGEEADS